MNKDRDAFNSDYTWTVDEDIMQAGRGGDCSWAVNRDMTHTGRRRDDNSAVDQIRTQAPSSRDDDRDVDQDTTSLRSRDDDRDVDEGTTHAGRRCIPQSPTHPGMEKVLMVNTSKINMSFLTMHLATNITNQR